MPPSADVKRHVTSPRQTPMDTGYSWVVMACSFMAFYSYNCVLSPAGIIQVEIMEDLQIGSGVVSTMTSLALGLPTFLGPISGVVANLLSVRYTVFLGTILTSVGLLCASFSRSVHMVLFFYGVVSGVGSGFILCPVIVVISMYFEKRRILATGIVFCASGLGRVSFPYLARYVIDLYGWRYCMAVNAAIVLHILVFAAFFRPTEVEKRRMVKPSLWCRRRTGSHRNKGSDVIIYDDCIDTEKEIQNDSHHQEDSSYDVLKINDDVNHNGGDDDDGDDDDTDYFADVPLFDSNVDRDFSRNKMADISASYSEKGISSVETPRIEAKQRRDSLTKEANEMQSSSRSLQLKDIGLKVSIVRICRNKALWIMCLHCFLYMCGYGIYYVHFPSYVKSIGLSPQLVAKFYTVSGSTLLAGRLLGALIFNRLNLYLIPLLFGLEVAMGLVFGLSPLYAFTPPAIFFMEACHGMLYGQTYMLQAPLVAQLVSVGDMPIAFGITQMFNGVGYVLAPIVAGFIYDVTKNYAIPMHMAGSFLLTGACILLAMLAVKGALRDRKTAGGQKKDSCHGRPEGEEVEEAALKGEIEDENKCIHGV